MAAAPSTRRQCLVTLSGRCVQGLGDTVTALPILASFDHISKKTLYVIVLTVCAMSTCVCATADFVQVKTASEVSLRCCQRHSPSVHASGVPRHCVCCVVYFR